MSSTKMHVSASSKRFPYDKLIVGILAANLLFSLLSLLPVTQQAVLALLGQPPEIALPETAQTSPIRPETAADVRLLQHWGNGTFQSIAWSPDGRYFAIGTMFGVNLYEARTFQPLRFIDLPVRDIDQVVFSPDGGFLALAAYQTRVLTLDLTNGKIMQWELDQPVVALAYLRDGTLVRVMDLGEGGNKRSILKLVRDHWELVKILDDDFLMGMAFVPEKQAFVVFYVNSVRLVDPLRGEETTLSFNVPYGIRYLLTQNTLITVDNTDSQTMASFRDGTLVKRVGFANWVNGPTASPDGNLLAAWGPGPVGITLWKLPSLERVRTISVPVTRLRLDGSLVFSPTGDRLAVLLSHSRVRIFSTVEGQSRDIVIDDPYAEWHNVIVTSAGRLRSMDLFLGLKQFLCSSLSSDGSVCVVHVGPVGSGDPNIVSIFQSKFPYYLQYTLSDTGSGEFRVSVSPSGKYVAGTSRSRTYLWVNGIQSERKYSPLSLQIAFSPDEKYVASASSILNLETGQVTATELVGEEDTYGVLNEPVFSPDGQILAAEMYGTISLWQVSNGALLTKLNDPYGSDRKLIFSPDGAFLIGLGESSISVWGIPQGTHQTD